MPIILNDIKLDFKDVLLRPKRSTLQSRSDVDIVREITFKNSKRTFKGVPIIASNMDTVGTFDMAIAIGRHGLFTTIHKYYTLEDWVKFADENPSLLEHVAVSSGSGHDDFDRMSKILNAIPPLSYVCLDVANGYTQHFVEFVRKTRAAYPTHTIIIEDTNLDATARAFRRDVTGGECLAVAGVSALLCKYFQAGNVVTGEMVEELLLSGADIIKVGIGPGSVCTTRLQTGVGYPQLSAVLECADAAHGLQGHIISDGGCTCPGDVAKAFGAGADFVMIGGMLAGHDESGGELIKKPDGRQVKLFYGMSSTTAMQKHVGGVAEYRSAEGKTVEIPYRGSVEGTILDVLGGIRSTCTYVGAHCIRELPRRATFIRCSQQANSVFNS